MSEPQVIPACRETATFVPAGQIIKVINTSGTQVIAMWAFPLSKPEAKKENEPAEKAEEQVVEKKHEVVARTQEDRLQQAVQQTKTSTKQQDAAAELPSQEEAQKATQQGIGQDRDVPQLTDSQKSTLGSYIPSIGWLSSEKPITKVKTQQEKDSKTWASYIPSGESFSNYVRSMPEPASKAVSSFAAAHQRDPKKSYIEQLQAFSKTPVGAAGWSGNSSPLTVNGSTCAYIWVAAIAGSGWTGSSWAGYQAWSAAQAAKILPLEFLSMRHSRTATLNLRLQVNDTLVSNLWEPMISLIEDTSGGGHNTLLAACDPARYRNSGVDDWQEQCGSCAENLVLALSELNERAGLTGPQAIGSEITTTNIPSPLNLFLNISCSQFGSLEVAKPTCKPGDYVRFKAERDIVVVMSAFLQNPTGDEDKVPTDAHFVVETGGGQTATLKRTARSGKERSAPRKLGPSRRASGVTATSGSTPAQMTPPLRRVMEVDTKSASAAQDEGKATEKPAVGLHTVMKKSVTAPVAPEKKASSTPQEAKSGDATAAPVQKKKPRKLNSKSTVGL